MRVSKPRKPRPAIDPIKTNVESAKKWVLAASKCQLCSTPRLSRGLPDDTSGDDGLSAPPPSPFTSLAHLTRRFQSFRVGLWQRGLADFGKVDDDTYFVMPVALRQPTTAVTNGDRLLMSAVIHSKNRKSRGIKREFDMRQLRATVPEPLPSPRSPNFDRDSLLAAASMEEWMVSPSTPVARGLVLTTTGESQVNPVPIHRPHARAHLPVLASILMSNLVQSGDKIDLPMPYPRAWTETAAYVYTGEEEMLTDEVKENIRYLGGRI
ncbi:hypothetical protein CP533_0895 [Ophiocordyceps camponoti-saundersi (nom. inval.)]|nr:hypothetical protein CP533_0895 [Ophiocordyceps camponoti-saundersi (nom. inval.)]